jgi:hypothetical protein
MESSGKSRLVPGSQEVIGSIPICSTKIIRGLQISEFVALSFLPVFCQPADQISDYAYAVNYVKNELPLHIKYITKQLVLQLNR